MTETAGIKALRTAQADPARGRDGVPCAQHLDGQSAARGVDRLQGAGRREPAVHGGVRGRDPGADRFQLGPLSAPEVRDGCLPGGHRHGSRPSARTLPGCAACATSVRTYAGTASISEPSGSWLSRLLSRPPRSRSGSSSSRLLDRRRGGR